MTQAKRKKIAIVGSGISGLSAAWALRDVADITLFEAAERFGGHSYTVEIDYDGKPISVDVGFIVCNPLNYKNFLQFLDCLNVETQLSDMSFAVSDRSRYEWSSNPKGIFAQKRNLLRPSFLKLLSDIFRFNKMARWDAEADALPSGLSLRQYVEENGFSQDFCNNYLYPMGAAIWSTPEADMMDYPARSFLNFFNNHKLLHTDRPQWRTVTGGSKTYVDQVIRTLGHRAVKNTPIHRIDRIKTGVLLSYNDMTEDFDEVILTGHAHQSKAILGDGFEYQANALSRVGRTDNIAYLHRDPSLMPKRKSAWASWNVMKGDDRKICLSYWMNALQGIPQDKPVFVTLNPPVPPAEDMTFGRFEFDHPLYNAERQETVQSMELWNGRDGAWFAGAWIGHGFHEDGLKSGLRVAMALGADLPWTPVDIPDFPAKDVLFTDTPETVLSTAAQ
ncbi:FAD-dependent oxidoreductase [Ponticaulis sp.]|uniref:NAD(P)/FAD-dependent oxidoreductase n=1 Tax=Ponticaulis sp. TaxID=2020902 RepID=UPI000B6B1B1C|nr:FAD-dependent oxidoreductase [Ponticaulis sp.]MAI89375.1 NAD/FAD-binding protein [Ponticaulis sp.]OUY00416.1 MAG: hypothetical protein CBB65_02945 [Hyphomonadaceae bacterium TMED5]|tara:strand:- start:11410 stop:12750 length:1341 start_codon:yes stop_codon:yes gene_type:complete